MINSMSNSTVANSYYLNQLANSRAAASSAASSSQTTETDDTTDELILSNAASQMMNSMGAGGMGGANGMQRPQGPPQGGAPPQGPPPDGAPGDKMAQEIEEKQSAFDSELAAKLEAAGVDTDQDITLGYDDEGSIIVTSDVSAEDRAVIESILAEDADLSASFNELTQLNAMAAEMEEMFGQGQGPQGAPPQGPPPQGMGGMQNGQANMMSFNGMSMSSIASAYAAQSNLAANSV